MIRFAVVVISILLGCSEKVQKAEGRPPMPVSWQVGDGRSVNAIRYFPDGKTLLAAGENKKIKIIDLSSGEAIWSSSEQPDAVLSVAVTPDGAYFAATCGDNTQQTAQVVVYETKTRAEVWGKKGLSNNVQLAEFSPDGKTLFVANHFHIFIFDVASGKQLYYFSGHAPDVVAPSGHVDAVTDIAFTSDATKFVSVGWDKNVKWWDIVSGMEMKNLPEADAINACFVDNDSIIVTAGAGGIHVWNRTSARMERAVEFVAEIKGMVVTGQHFVTIDEKMSITVWDRHSLNIVNTVKSAHERGIWGIAASPDGKTVATSGGSGVLTLWPFEFLTTQDK